MTRLSISAAGLVALLAAAVPFQASAEVGGSSGKPTPQWPITLAEAKPTAPAVTATPPPAGEPAPAASLGWSETEIVEARVQCAAILARTNAVAKPSPPIREGECGTPAPVELTSIGTSPQVVLSRPAIVTCEMVETLANWLKSDVQPAARKQLGAAVVRLDILSSYSCRNAYGRKKSRLSEHGRANALDIASFVTADGRQATLLGDWGLTERDIKARIAAAEAAARAQAEAKAAAEARNRAEADASRRRNRDGQPANQTARGSEGADPDQTSPLKGFVSDAIKRAAPRSGEPAMTLEQPSRLGGPKSARQRAIEPAPNVVTKEAEQSEVAGASRRSFLRDLHVSACRRFGTVLGPEANEAHRNHFHLDMAERPRGNYCE